MQKSPDFTPEFVLLSMSMAKSVVDAHHGTIRVESQHGRGTKFEVKIPRTPES